MMGEVLRRGWLPPLGLLLLAVAILFTHLGGARLWDRDEPRNAGCAAEMLARGDWVVPVFNDELRHQKPILLYWVMMASYLVFGVGEFAARFGSAAAALGTVAATYFIGWRLLGRSAGGWGAVALVSSLMFVVAGRAATPDSLLILATTAALGLFVWKAFPARDEGIAMPRGPIAFPRSLGFAAAFYAVAAVGVLAKGLIGIVLPAGIVGVFLLVVNARGIEDSDGEEEGRLQRLIRRLGAIVAPGHAGRTIRSMRPELAVVCLALLAGPWFAAVGWRTGGEYLKLFFLDEHFGRATTVLENHRGGVWYYPLALAIGFFPWSVFLGPMVMHFDRESARSDKVQPAWVFLGCWLLVPMALFTAASTKLPSYITPTYPAAALLVGGLLAATCDGRSRVSVFWLRGSALVMAISGVILAVGLTAAASIYLRGAWWIGSVGLVSAVGGWLSWRWLGKGRIRLALNVHAAVAVAFCLLVFGWVAPVVQRGSGPDGLWTWVRQQPPGVAVAAYRCLESSWVYYSGRPIWELSQGSVGGESLERGEVWWRKPRVSPAVFVAAHPEAILVTTDAHWDELRGQLPGDYEIVRVAPDFLKDRSILVAQRRSGAGGDLGEGQRRTAAAESSGSATTER